MIGEHLSSGQIYAFDLARQSYTRLVHQIRDASCLAFIPNASDDNRMLIGTKDGSIQTIDLGKYH